MAVGAFEHIIVLLSFVYALAIAHLLLSVTALIRASARVRFSWLHAYWMLNAVMVLVADWMSFWDMHALPNWDVGIIFFMLALACVDYMQAALVCPEVPATGPIDLVQFHREQSRRYIGAFAASQAMALIANTVFGGTFNIVEYMQQNFSVLPALAIALIAAIFRTRWVQIAAPLILIGLWAFYMSTLQGSLH